MDGGKQGLERGLAVGQWKRAQVVAIEKQQIEHEVHELVVAPFTQCILQTLKVTDTVLAQAPLVVGPGGLSTDTRLVRALADLAIYVRQHHLDAETTKSGADFLAATEVLGS